MIEIKGPLGPIQLKERLIPLGLKRSQVHQRSKLPIRGLSGWGFYPYASPHEAASDAPEECTESQQKQPGKTLVCRSMGAWGQAGIMVQGSGPQKSGAQRLEDSGCCGRVLCASSLSQQLGPGTAHHNSSTDPGRGQANFRMSLLTVQISPWSTSVPTGHHLLDQEQLSETLCSWMAQILS